MLLYIKVKSLCLYKKLPFYLYLFHSKTEELPWIKHISNPDKVMQLSHMNAWSIHEYAPFKHACCASCACVPAEVAPEIEVTLGVLTEERGGKPGFSLIGSNATSSLLPLPNANPFLCLPGEGGRCLQSLVHLLSNAIC